jgi:hypothetical protein
MLLEHHNHLLQVDVAIPGLCLVLPFFPLLSSSSFFLLAGNVRTTSDLGECSSLGPTR